MTHYPTHSTQLAPVERHTIFQNSLMTALLDGIYDGDMTVSELLGQGNFGIGTFDALDGEMIIVDGRCYQVRGDGTARPARLDQCSPFTVVTNFVPRISAHAPNDMSRSDLGTYIDSLQPSENYMYAVRISGQFHDVSVRTVTRQEKPYRPMVEATADDTEMHFTDVSGVIGGFRTPVYEKGISVPGCHVHFIDDARSHGGHVLDFRVKDAIIELCPATELNLRLPLSSDFSHADLAPENLDEQIHTTEVKS
ncbi:MULTISPECIES: acetolactate decarboxylase [Corynebacterium]|uniref:acetolactate decarboxylase n=1 Tax=Corynebacterium TaxID=1716 RepID=UPI00124EA66E|nr:MULTISPECIES: acetolactate decarboxylase [Corynebacterium]